MASPSLERHGPSGRCDVPSESRPFRSHGNDCHDASNSSRGRVLPSSRRLDLAGDFAVRACNPKPSGPTQANAHSSRLLRRPVTPRHIFQHCSNLGRGRAAVDALDALMGERASRRLPVAGFRRWEAGSGKRKLQSSVPECTDHTTGSPVFSPRGMRDYRQRELHAHGEACAGLAGRARDLTAH